MSKPLTKRQKQYREYLKGEHWKTIRSEAIKRDNGKCVDCEGVYRIQVHHKVYRTPLESCTVDDLETKCRECHRIEHGIGPDKFDMAIRETRRKLSMFESRNDLPEWDEIKKLVDLVQYEDQIEEVLSVIRLRATLRINDQQGRWKSWLSKPPEVTSRLWDWARQKYSTIEKELGYVWEDV